MPQILAECSRCHQLSSSAPADLGHGHFGGGVLDRIDDVHVSGAAAEIPRYRLADLGFAGVRVGGEQRGPGHQHAGGAEAALEAVFLHEALLERAHAVGAGEPLDRADLGAVGLDGQDGARLGGHAVDQHGARAAVRGVAPDVGAGEREFVADQVDEEQAGVDLARVRLAIDGDGDVVSGHVTMLLRARGPCGWPAR